MTDYEILEITEDAASDDIKQAYRNLIKIWHPDLHPDDEQAAAKTQSINEAYAVLSDPVKRAKYDEYLSLMRPVYDNGYDPFDDTGDFDMDYGDMSFEEYTENVSSGVYQAYKASSWAQSSRVDEAGYREYTRHHRSARNNGVDLLDLVRVVSVIIALIVIAIVIVRHTGLIPELSEVEDIPFPVYLLIAIFTVPSIISLFKKK